MAEEILIAELRIAHDQMRRDLQQAAQDAERGRREIAQALSRINDSVKPLPQSFQAFNSQLKNTESAARQTSGEVTRFSGTMQTLKNTATSMVGILAAIGFAKFAAEVAKGGEAILSLEAQLKVVTGSAQGAAQAMGFAASEAKRLAQDTLTAQKAFTQIATAAEDTAAEGKGAEIIFTGLSDAITATGKSGADFGRIINQVTQGLNKGKVQLEDLQVLAENGVPAQKLLANALGLTGEAFADAMSKGRVSAEAFILLGNELTEQYGRIAEEAATRLPGAFRTGLTEVKNEFRDLFAAIFESKELVKTLSPFITGLDIFPSRSEMVKHIDEFAKHLGEILAIGAVIFNGLKKIALTAFQDIVTALKDTFENVSGFVTTLANTKVPVPPIIRDLATGLETFFKTAETSVDSLGKKIKDMSTLDLFRNLRDDRNSLGSLTEMRKRLEEIFDVKGLGVIDAKVTGPAAQMSATAVEKELEVLEKTKDRVLGQMNAPSKAETEKQAKEVLAEQERHARERIELFRQNYEAEEKLAEQHAKDSIQMQQEVNKIRLKLEKEYQIEKQELQIQEDIYVDSVQPGTADPPMPFTETGIKDAEDQAKRMQDIFDNMGDNIQENLGDVLTNVFKGQIDSVKDVADAIVDIFARTAAEIAVAMAIQPMIDKATTWLIGNEPGKIGGALGGFMNKMTFNIPGGGQVTGGQIMTGVGGIGAGIGVGAGVNEMVGGGIAGGVLGGAAGGAVAGAMIGSILPGVGNAVGAAVGAVVGALAGLTSALIQAGKDVKVAIAPLTSPVPATSNVENNVSRRGPFGFISLVDQSSNTGLDTGMIATIIAEADEAISQLMSQRQRDIVAAALQGQHYALDAREMDDAIAQAIQTRLYIALASLTSPGTAEGIVGAPYTGTAANIETVQQRAAEALGILKLIEDFELEDMSEAAQDIRRIKEEFNALINSATSLGLDQEASRIAAERDEELAQYTTDFNANIRDQLLGFINPAQQAAEELERIQQEIWANAVESGADLAQVQELFAAQWADYAARWQTSEGEVVESLDGITGAVEQFSRGSLSGTTQQLIALREQFDPLLQEAVRLGSGIEALTQSYHEQHNAIVVAAQRGFDTALAGVTDNPFSAAMMQITADVEGFRKLVAEGILTKESVDVYEQASIEQARYTEAIRIATGATNDATKAFMDLFDSFVIDDSGMTDAQKQIQEINKTADALIEAINFIGGDAAAVAAQIDQVNAARQREIDEVNAQEAQRAAEELDAFTESLRNFTESTISSTAQQLSTLRQTFEELVEEAGRLGQSTEILTQSYQEQYNAIVMAAQQNFDSALAGITGNPLSVALIQIAQDIQEFQKLVDDGFIDQEDVDAYGEAARGQALYTEAIRLATGAVVTASQQFQQLFDDFVTDTSGLTDAEKQIQAINETADALIEALTLIGGFSMHENIAEVNEARNRQIAEANAAEAERAAAELDAFTESLRNFNQGTMSGTAQQLAALDATFADLSEEAVRLGQSTQQLTASYEEQRAAIILAAQRNVDAALLAIVDPFAAAMLQITIELENFQKLVDEGLVSQSSVDAWLAAAQNQAIWNDAVRISSGGASDAQAQFNSTLQSFIDAGSNVSAVQREINAVIFQFQNLELALIDLAARGAITEAQLAGYMADITASRDAQIAAINQAEKERQQAAAEAERQRRQAEAERRRQEAERARQQRQAEAERRRQEAERERERKRQEAQRRREERVAVKESIYAFNLFRLSGPGKELDSLRQRFEDIRAEARRLGVSTRVLTASYKAQEKQIRIQARQSLKDAVNAFVAPFASVHNAIFQQAVEFRRMQKEGLLSGSEVTNWQKFAVRDARFQEAGALAAGTSTAESQYKDTIQAFVTAGKPVSELGQKMTDLHRDAFRLMQGMAMLGMSVQPVIQSLNAQSLAIIKEAETRVWGVINSMGAPFRAAMETAKTEIEDLQKLVAAGLVPKAFVDYATRLIEADTLVNEALRRISGSPVNSIGQLADSFDEFIKAGNPMSGAAQELFNLTETFMALADAAHLLGYSTQELQQSYLAQSAVIRERVIEDIENQLSAQIQAIESIDTYLDSLRVAAEQPMNIRLDQAQKQFQEALAGEDIGKMVESAQTLRDIAREQFGSTAGFFNIETQIENALGNVRSREQALVDAERQRLTEQAERELIGLQIGQSSLDQLQRVALFGSRTAQGMDELIVLQRLASQRDDRTVALLERLLAEGRR